MQSAIVSVEDLAKAERLVRITNALIELQRELLEHLSEIERFDFCKNRLR